MNENEEKKRYLQQYREAKKKVKRISEQIAELRSNKMFPAAVVRDGMPSGHGCSDLSAYAARLDELIRQLGEEREQAVKQYAEIHAQILKIQDDTERELLIRRYLMGETWEKIAVAMDYDYRYVLKIHGRALKNFQIFERGH